MAEVGGMNMSDEKQHIFHVIWSEEDEEFVGLCDDFPSLSWLAPTREGALRGIQLLVKSITVELGPKNFEDRVDKSATDY